MLNQNGCKKMGDHLHCRYVTFFLKDRLFRFQSNFLTLRI